MMELTIGIVGATGAVGQTALDVLTEPFKGFKVKKVKVFASRASIGKKVSFGSAQLTLEETTLESLKQCDAVLFASEASVSQEFIPDLAASGVLCVDKSSAYRDHVEVPLVVPEVNSQCLHPDLLVKFPVVANPNCCATPLVIALKPLLENFGIERVIVSTYQSVSGAGKPGIDILHEEAKAFFAAEDLTCGSSAVFPKSIAFNVMPFVAKILPHGDTDEEIKIISETRKILSQPQLKMAVTSVRVPTFVGHAEAVTVELTSRASGKISVQEVRQALAKFPGLVFIDEFAQPEDDQDIALFATPREVHGTDAVYVSRVRDAGAFENGFSMWIVADNLRKGAALNAVQIIEACCLNGTMAQLAAKRGV